MKLWSSYCALALPFAGAVWALIQATDIYRGRPVRQAWAALVATGLLVVGALNLLFWLGPKG